MEKIRVNYEKMYYGFPIIMVSYYDEKGVPNITTLSSSFTLRNMILLGFGSDGYAVNQIKKIKDFVINVPDKNFMKELEICGLNSGENCNKFELSGLTPIKSDIVNAPMIKELPISIECTLKDVVEKDYFSGYTILISEIKGRCITSELLGDGSQLIYSKLDPVLYVANESRYVYRYTKENLMHSLKSFIK